MKSTKVEETATTKQVERPVQVIDNTFFKDSTLILNENVYWFEFGGRSIGKYNIYTQKWKIKKVEDPCGSCTIDNIINLHFDAANTGHDVPHTDRTFPFHMTNLFLRDLQWYAMLGGFAGENMRVYQKGRLVMGPPMITARNFFPAIYANRKLYVFGGYDDIRKAQLKSCEVLDLSSLHKQNVDDPLRKLPNLSWKEGREMHIERSQHAACKISEETFYVFGGYNKSMGTLDLIEKYDTKYDSWELINLRMVEPLRRFVAVKVERGVILLLGGVTKSSNESQSVFRWSIEGESFTELESLEKGGVIENEVLLDKNGMFHIFIEHANGTSPPAHIRYRYDPKELHDAKMHTTHGDF